MKHKFLYLRIFDKIIAVLYFKMINLKIFFGLEKNTKFFIKKETWIKEYSYLFAFKQ